MRLLRVEVCSEEEVLVTLLGAIPEPTAVRFRFQERRARSSRCLLPSKPDLPFQPPIIADDRDCSREINRAVQMAVGREVLWEEDPTQA